MRDQAIEEAVGVSSGYITEHIHNGYSVKLDDAVRFAEVAGKPIDWLSREEVWRRMTGGVNDERFDRV
jgi:hypothetical protein